MRVVDDGIHIRSTVFTTYLMGVFLIDLSENMHLLCPISKMPYRVYIASR